MNKLAKHTIRVALYYIVFWVAIFMLMWMFPSCKSSKHTAISSVAVVDSTAHRQLSYEKIANTSIFDYLSLQLDSFELCIEQMPIDVPAMPGDSVANLDEPLTAPCFNRVRLRANRAAVNKSSKTNSIEHSSSQQTDSLNLHRTTEQASSEDVDATAITEPPDITKTLILIIIVFIIILVLRRQK